jgi:hypothetical protein
VLSSSLSDFSDYDSSEEEYRAAHSRKASRGAASTFDPYASASASSSRGAGANANYDQAAYRSLEDEGADQGLMDPNDPFGDPFADDNESGKRRMGWAEI